MIWSAPRKRRRRGPEAASNPPSAERVDPSTRAAFLRKAGVFGGSIVAGSAGLGALPALASAKSKSQNLAILNFALTLEYLEAAFYKEAVRTSGTKGTAKRLTLKLATDEAARVKFLKGALGRNAVKSPKFNFRGTNHGSKKFLATAFALENEGVQAYSGQGPRLQNVDYVKAAISILTIEARHAGAIALINGGVSGKKGITPNGAFDKPKKAHTVLNDVNSLKFTGKLKGGPGLD